MAESNSGSRWTRRELLSATALGVAAAGLNAGLPSLARATPEAVAQRIARLTGGKEPQASNLITLDLPEVASDGRVVPVTVTVASPMTPQDYVKSVHVLAEYNPFPGVVSFGFTPRSGRASASTRMRLATTQNVVAVAELSDGSVLRTDKDITVLVGGCGG